MPRPTARVLALLELLEAGGTRTVAELSDRLGVDERTVRRYVDHLRDLDVPIESVRGRYGGYRLLPGYRMPPLMLTDDEALAIVLGLSGAGPGNPRAVESASAKVLRVLPGSLRERLDAVVATTAIEPGEMPSIDVLTGLASASMTGSPVRISYRSRDDQDSERVLEPYGLATLAGHWYVVGADSRSGEVRTFRVDRIGTLTQVDGSFERPESFDALARVAAGFAGSADMHEVVVRFQASADEVRARLPRIAEVSELSTGTDSSCRVTLRARSLSWVPAALAAVDSPFVVEAPDALREEVRALAERLRAAADGQ